TLHFLLSLYLMLPRPPTSTLFPYTTLFRSCDLIERLAPLFVEDPVRAEAFGEDLPRLRRLVKVPIAAGEEWGNRWDFNPLVENRSEEHTSELQSPCNLVCRLLLEKKNKSYFSYAMFATRLRSPLRCKSSMIMQIGTRHVRTPVTVNYHLP